MKEKIQVTFLKVLSVQTSYLGSSEVRLSQGVLSDWEVQAIQSNILVFLPLLFVAAALSSLLSEKKQTHKP